MVPDGCQHRPLSVREKGTGVGGRARAPQPWGQRGLWDIHKAGPQQAAVWTGLQLESELVNNIWKASRCYHGNREARGLPKRGRWKKRRPGKRPAQRRHGGG